MPTIRLPIAARDVARVAELAQVGVATVRRYRATWDGQPRYQLRRAQEAAITRAVGELPPVAHLDLPVVAPADNAPPMFLPDNMPPWCSPPPTDQEIDAALIVGDDIAPPARHLDEGVSRAARRCRVTVLMPDGSVVQP